VGGVWQLGKDDWQPARELSWQNKADLDTPEQAPGSPGNCGIVFRVSNTPGNLLEISKVFWKFSS